MEARPRPPLRLEFEPRFCRNHVVDLTAGCSFGCVYCPFAYAAARRARVNSPTSVDMRSLPALAAPPTVFLSPASDPFTAQAAPHTHELLEHVLPRGSIVGLLTKGVVPERTLDLLARHVNQWKGWWWGSRASTGRATGSSNPVAPPPKRASKRSGAWPRGAFPRLSGRTRSSRVSTTAASNWRGW